MSITLRPAAQSRAIVPPMMPWNPPQALHEPRSICGTRARADQDAFRQQAATRFQQRRSWTALTAVLSELRFTGSFSADFTAPFSRLLIVLEEGGGRMSLTAGSGDQAGSSGSSTIYYVPAGVPVHAHSDTLKFVRYLSLQFDPKALIGLAPADKRISLPSWPKMAFADEQIFALAKLFEAECTGQKETDQMFGDSLSLSLLCVLRGLDAPAAHLVKGGLSPRQLRTVTTFMEEHLGDGIAPADLATLVNLSASHFCRAFKASTGAPPHSWLTDLRIRKAREWLALSDQTLADIALAAGFSDQSHFTRVFARIAGVSPGAWRRRCSKQA